MGQVLSAAVWGVLDVTVDGAILCFLAYGIQAATEEEPQNDNVSCVAPNLDDGVHTEYPLGLCHPVSLYILVTVDSKYCY